PPGRGPSARARCRDRRPPVRRRTKGRARLRGTRRGRGHRYAPRSRGRSPGKDPTRAPTGARRGARSRERVACGSRTSWLARSCRARALASEDGGDSVPPPVDATTVPRVEAVARGERERAQVRGLAAHAGHRAQRRGGPGRVTTG